MKIMADTNVILDVLLKRVPFFDDSYTFLNLAAQDKISVMITSSSVTDIYFLLRKSNLSDFAARQALMQLFSITKPADVRAEDVYSALSSQVADFEDALVVEVAMRNKCSAVVTRNHKDFAKAGIDIYQPGEFIKTILP